MVEISNAELYSMIQEQAIQIQKLNTIVEKLLKGHERLDQIIEMQKQMKEVQEVTFKEIIRLIEMNREMILALAYATNCLDMDYYKQDKEYFEGLLRKYHFKKQNSSTVEVPKKEGSFQSRINNLRDYFKKGRIRKVGIREVTTMYQIVRSTATLTMKKIYEEYPKAFQWVQKAKKGKHSKISLLLVDPSFL